MIAFHTGDAVAKKTQNAGTLIKATLFGGFGFTHLINMRYTDTGTAHTLTIMRGATRTKAAAPVAAAGTSLIVLDLLYDGDGNVIATSDVIAIQLDNGRWHQTTVSALDTAKTTITLVNAVPTGRTILEGAKVVCYGVAGDTFHADYIYVGGASSAAVNYPAVTGAALSMCKASAANEPLIFDSNNATNAGTLNYANVGCTPM